MIRIDIVWKKILGCIKGTDFSAVWMDVQIFTFFLWLLPILAQFHFTIVGYSQQIHSAGWPGFPFGVLSLEDRGWSIKLWFLPVWSVQHPITVPAGSLKWSQRLGLTYNQGQAFSLADRSRVKLVVDPQTGQHISVHPQETRIGLQLSPAFLLTCFISSPNLSVSSLPCFLC